jgi:hypothetical protein
MEDRAAPSLRIPAVPPSREQLVERAVAPIDDERVAVRATLDRDVGPERVGPGSLSFAYVKLTDTLACPAPTTAYGMP